MVVEHFVVNRSRVEDIKGRTSKYLLDPSNCSVVETKKCKQDNLDRFCKEGDKVYIHPEKANKVKSVTAYTLTPEGERDLDIDVKFDKDREEYYFVPDILGTQVFLEVEYKFPLLIWLLVGLGALLLGLFIILFATGVIGGERNNTPVTPTEQTTPLAIDEDQGTYIPKNKKISQDKNIVMPGWGSFNIPANTTTVEEGMEVHNPIGNHWYQCPDCLCELRDDMCCPECGLTFTKENAIERIYYMRFGIYLSNNNECIYQSDLVAPGKYIQKFELTRPLAPGSYDAYVQIEPFFDDMASPTNGGQVKLKINVG